MLQMNPYAMAKMVSVAKSEIARQEVARLKRGPVPVNRVGGIMKRQTKCLIKD